ncbi:MAG: hypothetical protein PHW73_11935 [Atribacterota bacterium]|nr:hypothetical protein [Atribacterota bacterium]
MLYNDNRLHDIAIYAASAGYTVPATAENIKARKREFKIYLKSGEFASMDELENCVYERYGITKTDMDHCQDMCDEFKKRDEEKKRISGDNQKNT